MTRIKKIATKDYGAFVDIVANAYPGMMITSTEEKKRWHRWLLSAARQPDTAYYGAYHRRALVGGMALYDFTMNMNGTMIPAGGIGLVAVDLLHKKERICKDMVTYFIKRSLKENVHLTVLYPFRPDFYRKMGYGYGALLNQYSFRPGDLPRTPGKSLVQFLHKRDLRSIRACYGRVLKQRHGMMTDRETKWLRLFASPGVRVVGYKKGSSLSGYIIFAFRKAHETNWIKNDLVIREFMYESREAFAGLIAFLRSQSDQIDRIVYGTQDEHFHFLLHDPRSGTDSLLMPLGHETHTQGIGIMYRVSDVRSMFKRLARHRFGAVTMRLKVTVTDSFYPANAGSTLIAFADGVPSVTGRTRHDAEIMLDISDFSSLLVGAVDFRHLYRFGLADISDEQYAPLIDRLFRTPEKPLCTTQF